MQTNSEQNLTSSAERPCVFFSAGDPSGDAHLAKLIPQLAMRLPNAKFIAYAGPQTQKTVCDVRFDLTKFAVMMLVRAIANLPTYLKLLRDASKLFKEERPDLVVLVDFPGFNWKIAQRAKKAGIPVLYFMPPQIWGWGQWRVKKMRKYVDYVLTCFEFEDKWLQERGCKTAFIGHPFFESARAADLDDHFQKTLLAQTQGQRILAVLPGSRRQELDRNLDDLLDAAQDVVENTTDVTVVIATYSQEHSEIVQARLQARGLNFRVYAGKAREIMKNAVANLGVSGSVSIEALSLCKPTVILYKISKLEYRVLRFLKRVKYVTLANIIAVDLMPEQSPFYPRKYLPKQTAHTDQERELMLFPEYLSYRSHAQDAARILIEWLNNEEKRQELVQRIDQVRSRADLFPSPMQRAAEEIVSFMQKKQ
ncbi:MAG: lipid-A-disaccharide synthase [Planctomycetia bacterium]|nr:lipid-A-disaccharide synthase [Planctomycetia bacterium]